MTRSLPQGPLLTPELASRFAALALANIGRESPNKLDHVLGGAEDVASPRQLHPAFFGSFDGTPASTRTARALSPLARAFSERCLAWLADATYPVRHGVHTNSAFALAFALDCARACRDGDLRRTVDAKARAWETDADAPGSWEPSGADFLSPASIEAHLMRQIFAGEAFASWLSRFLPGIARREPASLFRPAVLSNRADPYIVHLDGLNLSRAWCWHAAALPRGDARVAIAEAAVAEHLGAGLAGVASGEYAGDHWLATFAVLALA